MSKLLEIHVKEGRFNQETGTAMAGALKYQDMKVKDVMTPLENTFMVNVDDKLNFETMAIIFKTGYSRIPVYESTPKNIVGLLFVKDLIFIDPEDETTVKQFIDIFGRQTHVVWSDDKLGDVLRYLKKGHTHMSFVRDINTGDGTKDPVYELRGIVTLEDIIEIILGDEILDETDAWMDPQQTERRDTFDWARLRLFDSKIVEETLSEDEVRAVVAHLRGNYKDYFTELSNKQLTKMIASIPVTELPEEEREVGELLPKKLLYEKNTDSNACTLILNGKVVVLAGKDNFRSDVSSWSLLAVGALADEAFAPDFSAYVSGGPCRCLSISREMFAAAMARSKLERLPKPASPKRNGTESGEGKMLFPLSIENTQPLPEESVHEQRGKLLNEFFTKKSHNGHNLVGGSTSASIEMEPRLDDLDDD
jgi:metal transporter CNNM